jgi:hypothetical protein
VQWDRLVWHPCEQGRWAVAVIETHGATADATDPDDGEALWDSSRVS